MDVLWSKERLQKIFSKDSIRLTVAHASGDGGSPIRCCRLCGGERNLRCFCETYLWEGIEERYDKLLYNCFGIQVLPTDGMICERCVRQLRNTQRFHALVQSAFAKPPSEFSTYRSQMGVGEGFVQHKAKNKAKPSRLDLAKKATKTTIDTGLRKRRAERKSILNANIQVRRTNIACTVCKQKYPMIVPFEGCKKFVCSRCKKKDESCSNVYRKWNLMPPKMLREQIELRSKSEPKKRLCSVQKRPSQIFKLESFTRPKYQCNQCAKKYSVAQHLTQHVTSVHKQNIEVTDCVCAVCGKDMNTREMLERHMRMHTGQPLYQCDVCMRTFKGKRSFQTHYLTHGK